MKICGNPDSRASARDKTRSPPRKRGWRRWDPGDSAFFPTNALSGNYRTDFFLTLPRLQRHGPPSRSETETKRTTVQSVPEQDKGKLKGHVALWVANIIWGLNAPIGKSVLISATNPGGISPFAMSVYRMIGAALLFWTASLFLPRERVTRRDIVLLFFASLFGIPAQPDAFPLGAVAHIAHRHLDHRHDRPRAHDDPRHASSCANPSPGSRPGAYSSAAPEAVLLISSASTARDTPPASRATCSASSAPSATPPTSRLSATSSSATRP